MLTLRWRTRTGLAEGGIPICRQSSDASGRLVSVERNRRVQNGDPSMHGKQTPFRHAGRPAQLIEFDHVSTLAPCWYCSGLVAQFGFRTVVVGESRKFQGGLDCSVRWCSGNRFDSAECVQSLAE